jgi:perosamine synthetase
MKIAVFGQDDSASQCLPILASKGHEVLGLTTAQCSGFSQQCSNLNFGCISSSDGELLQMAAQKFQPRLASSVPVLDQASTFKSDKISCYALQFGEVCPGAPWPEFVPIWENKSESSVSIVTAEGAVLYSMTVNIGEDDTALTLRMKHVEAGLKLMDKFLAEIDDLPSKASVPEAPCPKKVPEMIALDWTDKEVACFIRAMSMAPYDPPMVEDPNSGEKYFIENILQWFNFRSTVLGEKPQEDASQPSQKGNSGYAADTHWYSNVGGSIVKLVDRNCHAPRKVSEKSKAAIIPGQAVGAGTRRLRMNEPLIGVNAAGYCNQALSSSWIGVEGPKVKKFESELARICGCAAAVAVQSGTAALYGAMKALGVTAPNHHVLCPSFTCAACADAVVHAGGTPIPVDCELDTFGLSFDAVKAAIESDSDVVGVVVAPCYGVPARDYLAIAQLCKSKGLWICEDNCETYGATMLGPDGPVPVGSLGTMCVVSVRSEKMIGVGEGGAILSNDTMLVSKARWWCSRAPCRGGGLWRVYEHEGIGQNFRLPEMLAAVGCGAAEMLPLMIERKRAIHTWYQKYLQGAEFEGLKLQCTGAPEDRPVWWLNTVLLPVGSEPAETVGMRLMATNPHIEIRPGFFPLQQMEIFKHPTLAQPCPNSDALFERLLCLPSSHQLQEGDIKNICTALAAAIKEGKH